MIAKLIWRNLWRNSRRTLITIASIAFAVLFSIVMKSFQDGIFDNLVKNIVSYYSGNIQIHKNGYWNEQVLDNCFEMDHSLLNSLNENSQLYYYAPRLETFLLASNDKTSKGCVLIGTDTEKENKLTQLKCKIIKGHYFQNEEKTVVIAEGLAKRLNLKVADTIVLFGQGLHGVLAAGKYKINGIVKLALPTMNDAFVYLPLKETQSFLSAQNQLTSIAIGIKNTANLDLINSNLKSKTSQIYEVMRWQEMMPEIANHIKADGFSFYVFSGILYLIIAFGLLGTTLMMTMERKYEFGMLIAIGMKKSKLGFILFGETLLLTLFGVLLGIFISLPLVIHLNINPLRFSGEIAKTYEQFGFEAIFPTSLNSKIFITQTLIVLIIALCIGLYPIWHIIKLDPIKAMKK